MTEIYSKIDPDKLLHFIRRKGEGRVSRFDAICDKEPLQLSILNMQEGKTFKPHKHNDREIKYFGRAQESWVVIEGKVQVSYYDEDGKLLSVHVLNVGDVSVTLYGGHSYEIMEEGTEVYEFKTGPYEGQEIDKTYF